MPPFAGRLLLILALVCGANAADDECPVGDLSGDCEIGFADVWALTSYWLDPPGGEGDLRGIDGVNMGDFAALAGNWGNTGSPVIINEIHCDPDVKTDPLEFVELYNRTTRDVNISGWYFRNGVTYTFPANTTLVSHGHIVVCQSPERVRTKYGGRGTPSYLFHGPWAGRLENDGERIELCDAQGRQVDRVSYKLGFPWPTVGDSVPDVEPNNGTGHSMQLVNPFIDNDLGGSWRSAYPTAAVSNHVVDLDNPPPHLRQVKHEPKEPGTGQDVKITAKITDSDGVAGVTLSYQIIHPGSYLQLNDPQYATAWAALPMNDNGTDGDEEANDDVFTVSLPGSMQIHRRLIRYRITAVDNLGAEVTGPYPDDPVPNFAYFVYDGVPAWHGRISSGLPVVEYGTELMRSLPAYHLISKKSDVERCTWIEKYPGDEYKWWGTLVYDGKVYDHIRYRARGGVWRYAMGKNMWKFDFNRGHRFQARDDYGRKYQTKWDKLNFSACIQQGNYWHRGEHGMFEAVGFRLFNLAGVEAPKTHYVQFRIIDEAGETGANQYIGDFWGLYLVLEQMDGRFLDEHLLPDGNLYKMEGGTGDLNNQGRTAATNKSDLNAFMSGYSTYPGEGWWLTNLDVDKYFSYRTIVDGIHHYDIGRGKNYFYYLSPVPNSSGHYLWSQLPWDLDLTWANNMYDCGNSGRDPFKQYGLWDNSILRIRRNNRIREIRDLLFNTEECYRLIDDVAAVIDTPQDGPSMVDADRAMWDYNPIMTSGYVNSSKAGQGRFYAGGSGISIPSPGGFRGMAQLMKNFVVTRSTIGDPGKGEAALDTMAQDADIPYTPIISYTGEPGFPINTLTFESSPFDDPQGNRLRPGTASRIAEIASDQPLGPGDGVLVSEQTRWKYFKGTGEPSEVQGQWRVLGFAEDRDWIEGDTPIGYGEPFVATELYDMQGSYSTVYLRKEFSVPDAGAIDELIVEAMYDDGFNLWINGVYAGGRNVSAIELPYTSVTGTHSEHSSFQEIVRLDPAAYLYNGRNMLAVQAINQSLADSADCFIDVRLTAALGDNPPDQRTRPTYEIEAVWEDTNPNEYNRTVHIPATVVKPGSRYRVRCRMMDNTFRWSHWSDPIEFVAGEAAPTPLLEHLRITEVMYNPAPADTSRGELDVDRDEFEFIELKNTGGESLDLFDAVFMQGITFYFDPSTDPNVITSIDPGEFLLVVRNRDAFRSRYGSQLDGIVAGQWIDYNDTKLSNGGETVTLSDTWNGEIVSFTYSDDRGWPLPADGSGHSLVPLDSAIPGQPYGLLDYGGNWRHSTIINGSPGQDDPVFPASIVLNEVMAHTDYNNPAHPEHDSDDWIELYNASGTTRNLGGWYLSDDREEPNKWAIPSVNISVNGRVSFNEVDHFHNPITTGFGLDKAGEEVLLSYLPGTPEDRVVDYIRFKGEENFVSLGRYPDGGAHWLHMVPSRDLPNSSGVADIVIDEIMYHPMDPNEEYVELYNPTGSRIYLENDDGAWRLDDEDTGGYVFDPGTYIDPNSRLIVVGFWPEAEPAKLSAFTSAYDTGPLVAGVDIVGPLPGKLANEGERIALKRPQAPDEPTDPISWVIVDEVIYSDTWPWPSQADGLGPALQRNWADSQHSGRDPANWRAEDPTPGTSP